MRILKAQISKFFWLKEVACKDTLKSVILTPAIIDHARRLDGIRILLKRIIRPTSWYRTTAYNKLVGGFVNSWHIKGLATDFKYYTSDCVTADEIVKEWFRLCEADGIPGGAIIYKTFIHLDSRTDERYFDDKR